MRTITTLLLFLVSVPSFAAEVYHDEFTGERSCYTFANDVPSEDAAYVQVAGWRGADEYEVYPPELFVRFYLRDWAFIDAPLELIVDGQRTRMAIIELDNYMGDLTERRAPRLVETGRFSGLDTIRAIASAEEPVRARLRGRNRPVVFTMGDGVKTALNDFLSECVDRTDWAD